MNKSIIILSIIILVSGCDPVGKSSNDLYVGHLIEQQWDGNSTTIVTPIMTLEVTGQIPLDDLLGAFVWINTNTQTVLIRSTRNHYQPDTRMQLISWKYI